MTLKSFPRGGKKPEFKESQGLSDWKPNKSNKKSKTQIRNRDTTAEETNLIATTAERLSNLTLYDGIVVLGRVSKVTEYELIVSIPGGLLGRVQVTDVSESYTTLLQNIIDSKVTQSSEFKSLPDLYNCGDYVTCYVKSINPEGKWLYSLSLEPQLINQNIDNNYLTKGTTIACIIKSIEDHGYVVDTGVANVRAFVSTKYVDKGKQYFPGNQVFCIVKEIKTEDHHVSIVTLAAKKKIVDSVSTHEISLNVLTPGTKVYLCVTKVLSNGLQISFGKNNVGYINQIYLDNPLSSYTENMELIGTLLYIMPTVKLAYFSLLTNESEKEKTLNVGDIIKKAKVLFRESNGIIFKLSKSGLRGFVSLRRTGVSIVKIPTDFKSGAVHKCRILSYNWMEHVYVCTMEDEILKQRYFTCSDLNIGDTLTVKITNIDTKSGFVRVQVGKIHGIVSPEHISDSGLNALNKLTCGDDVEARVLDINNDKQNVKFTLKHSLIKSELAVLHDIEKARCGSICYHGTVTKINKNGLLVRFYGGVKGWVPHTVLDKDTADMNWNYSLGQTVAVSIDSVQKNDGKMRLRIVTGEEKHQRSIALPIGKLVEGTVVYSCFEGVYLRICRANDGADDGVDDEASAIVTGFLPADHMAPCSQIGSLLASKCILGDTVSAFVFATQPCIILSRTYVTEDRFRSFDALKVGDCIPCTIRDILQDGVRVVLPIEDYSMFGYVSYKNISNFKALRVNQILFVKITAINTRRKQLSLTMVLKDIWDSPLEHETKIMSAVDVLSLYLNKLSELSTNSFYRDKPISLVTLGQKVTGNVEKITEYGLILRLDNDLMGTVRRDHYSGINVKVGDKIFGTILWKNYINDLVDVSLLPRIVNGISSRQKTLPQLPNTVVLKGEILMITSWLILVLVRRNGAGYLTALPVRRHINDIFPDLTPYAIHTRIRICVVTNGNESDIVPICMLKSAFEMPKEAVIAQLAPTVNKKSKRKMAVQRDVASASKKPKIENDDDDEETNNYGGAEEKRLKREASDADVKKEKVESRHDSNIKSKKRGRKEKYEDKETAEDRIKDINENSEVDSSSDESKTNDYLPVTTEAQSHLPECGFNWDDRSKVAVPAETSSDDEEEEEESSERESETKKLSSSERREQERQKEREIRQWEEVLARKRLPNSIDQFDKLVVFSPDSSLVWLQYMAYHLQATDIDAARAVAKRAISTINFREENERLNVWSGWLNLESKFGTSESLDNVFREAVRMNDALKVYTHMLAVYADAGKQAELEKLIRIMTGKFKQEPQMWVHCGAALLKVGLKEKSRHIMQRALQSLPATQHVNLIVRFANLENKFGEKERSQMLFEQILISYPKRVDVWSSYVDCLVKCGDIDVARKVLEQAVVQTLPAKKMKTLFKKFMSFEEKYGTPEAVVKVQRLAADYVEKQCNRESV